MKQIPFVTAITTDATGRVLLGRHRRDQLWGTIGGALRPEENPRLGLAREVYEEVGLQIHVGPLLNAHCSALTTTSYESGDTVNALALVFHCTPTSPTAPVKVDHDEIVEANWFSAAEALQLRGKVWLPLVLADWAELRSTR